MDTIYVLVPDKLSSGWTGAGSHISPSSSAYVEDNGKINSEILERRPTGDF